MCVCFQCYVTDHAMKIWTVMSESMNAFTSYLVSQSIPTTRTTPLPSTLPPPLHCLTHFPSQSPRQCVVISWETSSKRGSSSCMPRKRNTDSLVARCLNTSYTTTGLLHDRGRYNHSLLRHSRHSSQVTRSCDCHVTAHTPCFKL